MKLEFALRNSMWQITLVTAKQKNNLPDLLGEQKVTTNYIPPGNHGNSSLK